MVKGKYGNRNLIVVVLVIIAVLLAPMVLSGDLLLTTYGDVVFYNETTDELVSAGDILSVQDGDTLVAWLVDNVSTQHKPTDLDWTVTLRLVSSNAWVETGGDASKVGEVYSSVVGDSVRWWFNLEACPEGTFDYIVNWFAMIGDTDIAVSGNSGIIQIQNTGSAVYDEPVFVSVPEDTLSYDVGQYAAYATWEVDYKGAYTASVTVDGVEDWTRDYIATEATELVIYTVDTSVAGVQSIVLIVVPSVDGNSPLVSDGIEVTVSGSDTTTTDTGTTGTVTNTDDPPEPEDNMMLVYGGIAVAVVAVLIVTKRRK